MLEEMELQPVKFCNGPCVGAHYSACLAASEVERGQAGLGQGCGEVSSRLEMRGSMGMWRG